MKVLVTGANGMLGRYVCDAFADEEVKTLGIAENNDFKCNLRDNVPSELTPGAKLPGGNETAEYRASENRSSENRTLKNGNGVGEFFPDTVIHCAGSEEDSDEGASLNYDGTRHLCMALDANPPSNFVYISSYKVYGEDAGENVEESASLFATDKAGKSKARTEEWLREWAERNEVTLTIIRPSRMFGEGVGGETLRLFNDAIKGNYIHVRGNDARVSLVTAYDVARGIRRLFDEGGVYNAADGANPRYIEMMEAMTANAGAKKRMTHLPAPWALWLWRILRFVPSINRHLHPEVVESRMKSVTLDGRKFADRAGIEYFDTISVIEHTSADYPYLQKGIGR